MSGLLLLSGPQLTFDQGVELLRAIAPLVVDRPLALELVESTQESDQNCATSDCGTRLFRDGDVTLRASMGNGDGNPRDGYGYSIRIQVLGPYRDRAEHWRVDLGTGSWEPRFERQLRISLLGVSPAQREAISALLRARYLEHRDVSFDDPWGVRGTLDDFERHGHVAWVREFLSLPLSVKDAWVTAHLCARKLALLGPDAETARTCVTIEPFASDGWRALADSGGDASTSAREARELAALTNPFDVARVLAAAPSRLAGAIAHVVCDPRWRWLEASARDAFEANRDAFAPAPSRRVTWTRPLTITFGRIDVEILTRLGVPAALQIEHHTIANGPPLAPPGTLPHTFGIGTGHSVRRALLDLASPIDTSTTAAVCHVNCEDRLASFGLAWLGPDHQVVWRSSVHEHSGKGVRTPIEIDVIDHGDGTWAEETIAKLEAKAG